MTDIVVAGGGPAGTLTASMLAADGRDVVVLEDHDNIGEPVHCAGIVSDNFIRSIPISPDIVSTIRHAKVVFPDGRTMELDRKSPFGYLVDRPSLDQKLADHAVANGVDLRLGTSFNGAVATEDGITANTSKGDIKADLLIGADGQNSHVARFINASYAREYLLGAQVDLPVPCEAEDMMTLRIGNSVAPGLFSWKLPLGDKRTRYGLCVSPGSGSVRQYLTNLVKLDGYDIDMPGAFRFGGKIPIGPRSTTVGNRTLLIGDAASQVKPISAGGLAPIAEIAPILCDTVREAYDNNLFTSAVLGQYEVNWKRAMKEFDSALKIRRMYCRMSDDLMNRVGEVFDKPAICEMLSSLDIDNPSLAARQILSQKGVKSALFPIFLKALLCRK